MRIAYSAVNSQAEIKSIGLITQTMEDIPERK
jgi:hypothetical protein